MTMNLAYQRAVWNLATESLPAAGWGDFRKLPDFPDRAQPDVKLEWLDRHLKHALAPEDIRANPNLRHEHMRGDLNKYHPWLLRAVLRHLYETHISHIQSPLRLPEDLPKVIADLHLFHKNYRELAEKTGDIRKGSIQHYGTLDEFHKIIDLVRPPPCPLNEYERENAFRRHLKDYGGDGGATLLATLANGTMVIQLNTEEASIALGSPYWCTAYRNKKTYFQSYAEDLLLILEPDGRRHQIHFNTGSCNDANDNPVRIRDICLSNPQLDSALKPFLTSSIENRKRITQPEFMDILGMCTDCAALEDAIIESKFIQKSLYYVIEKTPHVSKVGEMIANCIAHQKWEDTLAKPDGISEALKLSIAQMKYSSRFILDACKESPALTTALCTPEGIPAAISMAVDMGIQSAGNMRSGHTHTSAYQTYKNLIECCETYMPYAEALIEETNGLPRMIRQTEVRGLGYTANMLAKDYRELREYITTQTSQTSGIRSAAACRPARALQSML